MSLNQFPVIDLRSEVELMHLLRMHRHYYHVQIRRHWTDSEFAKTLPCCQVIFKRLNARVLSLSKDTHTLNGSDLEQPKHFFNVSDNEDSELVNNDLQVGPKIDTTSLYASTLPNINQFSKIFHCQNQEKICNNTITKDPITPQVRRYTTLWNVKCLRSNNWKQDNFCNN